MLHDEDVGDINTAPLMVKVSSSSPGLQRTGHKDSSLPQESLQLVGHSEKSRPKVPPPPPPGRRGTPHLSSFSLPLSSHTHSSHHPRLLPLPLSRPSLPLPAPLLSPTLSDLYVGEKSELKGLLLNSLQVNWMILIDDSGQQDFPD